MNMECKRGKKMSDFLIKQYSDSNAYLIDTKEYVNDKKPYYAKHNKNYDPIRFVGVPYIPVKEILSEKENSHSKVFVPCPEGWKRLEWRIAYEAIYQLCTDEYFKKCYNECGRIDVYVHEINKGTWRAYCEDKPESTMVIIPRHRLLKCNTSSEKGIDLRINEYKFQTKVFLFDQRELLAKYRCNKESEDILKELQSAKKDLEKVIRIAGLSDEIAYIYKKIDDILFEHGL